MLSLIGTVLLETKYDPDMDLFETLGYCCLYTVYGFIFYYVARAYSAFRHAGGIVGFRDEETGEFVKVQELPEDRLWKRTMSFARKGGELAEKTLEQKRRE